MQVPDDAVQITADSITVNLQNVAVIDQFQFPGGTGNVPVTLSYVATYTRSGSPRLVHPTSRDPLSPFAWAGRMSNATNSGNFSLAYNDGSFSAQGSFSSSGNFGEIGTERNGSFASEEEDDQQAALVSPAQITATGEPAVLAPIQKITEERTLSRNVPLLKGRVPLKGAWALSPSSTGSP